MYLFFFVPFLKHQERTGKDKLGATRSLKNPQTLLSPSLVLSESLDLFVTPSSLYLCLSLLFCLFCLNDSLTLLCHTLSASLPLFSGCRRQFLLERWCFMLDCGSIQNLESSRC